MPQAWTQMPDFETHWQLASLLHATFDEYSSPQDSVHVRPFHWHVVSREQSPLLVLRAHDVLQL